MRTTTLGSIVLMGSLLVTPCVAAAGSPAATPPGTPIPAAQLEWQLVSVRPHDPAAWTQGLQFDEAGRLYESTGLLGHSSLREVDPETGEVLRSVRLPDDQFGEGLASIDDRLVQLTWQQGIATVRDSATFAPLEVFGYGGEGWGLCYDGARLVMSDGSSSLTFRDADTFVRLGGIDVVIDGEPAGRLNELECVGDTVWANLYQTSRIARIDPTTGQVTGILDLGALVQSQPADADVLNGIAYDVVTDTYLVTGKLWPQVYEIRVSDPA